MNDSPFISAEALTSHPGLRQLAGDLRTRFHDRIVAILIYGSCLRSGDPGDGLVDLYILCDDYREAHGGALRALANRMLPPNVYYAQSDLGGETIRAKVALLSLGQFRRACSPRWFESYIWGRFAQPIALLYVRNNRVLQCLDAALCDAQRTLLLRALPMLASRGSVAELWSQALTLSYGTELRTERHGRAEALVAWQPAFYRNALLCAAKRGLPGLQIDGDTYRYTGAGRRAVQMSWRLRRLQGKLLSLLRLLKAFFTFDGGLDYLVWKLERHSGESITLPPRVRRYPLLFAWGFFWGLYRRGIFR